MIDNYLYHYTTTDAFNVMLNQMKEKKSTDLTFWASNVHYMNDPHEMEFLYDELCNILPEVEKELGISENPFSAFDFSKVSQEFGLDLEKDIKDNIFHGIFKSVYAISFSKREDYLPMWSLYGNNGGGLCLKFDYNKLKDYLDKNKKDDFTKEIVEIKYNLKDKWIWNLIKQYYQEYHMTIDTNSQGKDPLQLRRTYISRVLLEISKMMKHHSYSYEEEVRLVDHIILLEELDDRFQKIKTQPLNHSFKKPAEPKVRVKNGLLIPYKEIKLPTSCLTSVIVGPTINSRLQCEAMELLLKRAELEIKVIPSSIPFRQL